MAAKDTASHLEPTPLEMAYRHQTARRAHLALARQYGNTPKGRHYAELAKANEAVELTMRELNRTQLYARDGLLDDLRRQKENALVAQ